MPTIHTHTIIGLVSSALFALALFILIPLGIEQPMSHDPGQLSPAAYPRWIATAGLLFSLGLTAQAILKKQGSDTKKVEGTALSQEIWWAKTLSAFALLFVFYLTLQHIGMIVGSFILYACFACLSGERNVLRLIVVDTLLCAILYVFFVRMASVPVPLGILQNLL